MSKDHSNSGNDISWLANPAFISSSNDSVFPKLPEISPFDQVEPWESQTNIDQVCRNLNNNWMTRKDTTSRNKCALDFSTTGMKCNSLNLAENLSLSFLKAYCREPLVQNVEHENSQNLSYFDALSNNMESMKNQKNSSHFLNYQESIQSPALPASSFPFNFEHLTSELLNLKMCENNYALNDHCLEEKKSPARMSLPITPIDSSSSSASSAPPQKLNTDLVALMQELAKENNEYKHQNALFRLQTPPPTPTKGCVFCKNNCYHSTFYKSHVLKDDNGCCQCPVLRTYICPLCGGTGDFAHTLKYCPRNTVTKGDPIAAGLPPGKVTNWREVATRMSLQRKHYS